MKLPKMNAVLYKDMQLQVKKAKTSVIIFVINLILFIIAAVVMLAISANYTSHSAIDNRVLISLFIGLIGTEAVLIGLMVPSFTAGAISGERERQTIDVLLTTKMTPWEIVKGKYWSSIMQMLLLIVSGLPIFALVFIYGGISFGQVLLVIVSVITSLMFLASIGVYFSAVMKKTSSATILTFIVMFLYLFGTIFFVFIAFAIVMYYNDYCYYTLQSIPTYNYYNIGPLAFVLYLNPMATVFEVLVRSLGVEIDYTQISGMGTLLKELEIIPYSESNIFLRFWGIISIAVQMGVTYLHLRLAARALDPLKTRRGKNATKGKRQSNN